MISWLGAVIVGIIIIAIGYIIQRFTTGILNKIGFALYIIGAALIVIGLVLLAATFLFIMPFLI